MTIVKLDFLVKLKGKPSLISKDKKIITEYFNQLMPDPEPMSTQYPREIAIQQSGAQGRVTKIHCENHCEL